jgi:uncharacterized protein (TIGR02186 family)
MTPRRILLAFLLCVLAAALSPAAARADYLVADLSKRRIDITLGFAGAEVLLFGATDGQGDVVVIVRGPNQPVIVRHKERIAGIWINWHWAEFSRAPAFYYVASSKPLDEIAGESVLAGIGAGLANVRTMVASASQDVDTTAFRQALVGAKESESLYGTGPGDVTFLAGRLFRTTVSFPANVAPGPYDIEIYLVRDGHVERGERRTLFITKVGLSAAVYERAHENAALYGLVAVAIALMAGWLGAIGLRKV